MPSAATAQPPTHPPNASDCGRTPERKASVKDRDRKRLALWSPGDGHAREAGRHLKALIHHRVESTSVATARITAVARSASVGNQVWVWVKVGNSTHAFALWPARTLQSARRCRFCGSPGSSAHSRSARNTAESVCSHRKQFSAAARRAAAQPPSGTIPTRTSERFKVSCDVFKKSLLFLLT
jgi:hypothetical protein